MKSVLYRDSRHSVLVIANYSCHCETCRIHGTAISSLTDGHEAESLSPWQPWTCRGSCLRTLSLRWSEKIFSRSLNVSLPRATLVAWWKQSPCKQHLFLNYFATLVMTKTKIATLRSRWQVVFPRLSLVEFYRNPFRSAMPTRTSAVAAALACRVL